MISQPQEAPSPPLPQPRLCRPRLTALVLAGADLAALTACGSLAVYGYLALGGRYQPALYGHLWPCLLLFILAYDLVGMYHGVALYPGAGLGPAEELRRGSIATTACYLLLASATFVSKTSNQYSRAVFLIAWMLSLALLPALRAGLRSWLAGRPWWGASCAIFGGGDALHHVLHVLRRHPEYGLKPCAVVAEDMDDSAPALRGLTVGRGPDAAERLAAQGVTYAIIVIPSQTRADLLALIERVGQSFQHILVIPGVLGHAAVWANSRCIETILGLEVRQNLLLPVPRLCKRLTDLAVGLAFLALLALPILAVAALVRLTSRGPGFYGQMRLGRGGRPFRMWKFRTMYAAADRLLADHLAGSPEARQEWERTHKLRDDPRVTPLGRFLRRLSLDELPQVWNVIRGDMSLVGPRPIVSAEISSYGPAFSLYSRVHPGLTGLWQVSGRNTLPFAERIELDAFYVRNWSVWLDLYILMRTLRAVLTAEGAY
jgi:Undecaprenyl-phosphate galactose phosphotransferase WbaP